MEIVFHIGWPKSGTSSIQSQLAINAGHLARNGVLYPDIARTGDAHHAVCSLFIEHRDPLIPPLDLSLEDLIAYLEAPEHRGIHTTILSSEGFCRAEAIKPSLAALATRFDVSVVACLRDPLVWANSLMNQKVKMRLFFGPNLDLEALAEEMILRDFEYSDRLQMWADSIGRSKVTVLPLEEGDNFSAMFFETLGIGDAMLPDAPPRHSANRSLDLGSLQVISWLLRQEHPLDHSRKVTLNQRLHDTASSDVPNVLKPAISDRIVSRRAEVISSLADNWLDGAMCFRKEIALPAYRDVHALDAPNIEEVAARVLGDDPELLQSFRQEL